MFQLVTALGMDEHEVVVAEDSRGVAMREPGLLDRGE